MKLLLLLLHQFEVSTACTGAQGNKKLWEFFPFGLMEYLEFRLIERVLPTRIDKHRRSWYNRIRSWKT